MAVSFIGGGNWSSQRKPPICRKSLTNFITKCCIEYTSPWAGFEFTTLVVIGTDCIGSWKPNHHTITTTTNPLSFSIQTRARYRILTRPTVSSLWGTIPLNLLKRCSFENCMLSSLIEFITGIQNGSDNTSGNLFYFPTRNIGISYHGMNSSTPVQTTYGNGGYNTSSKHPHPTKQNGWLYDSWGRRGRGRMVVGCTTTYATSAYHHSCCVQHYVIKSISDLQQIGEFLRVFRFRLDIYWYSQTQTCA